MFLQNFVNFINAINYRDISHLHTSYELYAGIINGRLKCAPIRKIDVRKKKSCIDVIFTQKQIKEKVKEYNFCIYRYRKSYYWQQICVVKIVKWRKILSKLTAILQCLYSGGTVILKLLCELTADINTNKEARQDCPLSPTI